MTDPITEHFMDYVDALPDLLERLAYVAQESAARDIPAHLRSACFAYLAAHVDWQAVERRCVYHELDGPRRAALAQFFSGARDATYDAPGAPIPLPTDRVTPPGSGGQP